jgi:hypothetical protein
MKFKIYMFGRNIKNESVGIVVNDYTPYFYLKYPDYWNKTRINKFIKKLKKSFLE